MHFGDLLDPSVIESNENKTEEVEVYTTEQLLEAGTIIAASEAELAIIGDAYDTLVSTMDGYQQLSDIATTEEASEAAVGAALTSIGIVTSVAKLDGIVEESVESVATVIASAKAAAETAIAKIATAFKTWSGKIAIYIITATKSSDKMITKLGTIKGDTKINITVDVIKAANGIGYDAEWISDYYAGVGGNPLESAFYKAYDKVVTKLEDFTSQLDGFVLNNASQLLKINKGEEGKRALVSRLGNGTFGVLSWKNKDEREGSTLRYSKTTAILVCKAKVGEGKFSELKLDTKELKNIITKVTTKIDKAIVSAGAQIEATSANIGAKIEEFKGKEGKEAEVNAIRANNIAIVRFLNDKIVGEIMVFRNVKTILDAVIVEKKEKKEEKKEEK